MVLAIELKVLYLFHYMLQCSYPLAPLETLNKSYNEMTILLVHSHVLSNVVVRKIYKYTIEIFKYFMTSETGV